MPSASTGVTVSFGDIVATEVVGLSWTFGGGLPKGRSVIWTDDAGSVTVETLSSTSTGLYGVLDTLTIEGGGMNLTATACCTSVSASAELNGVTRYATEFKIIK